MKYAKEVLGLMRAYPGREFRMSQLLREVNGGRTLTARESEAARKGVRRVLDDMIEAGLVDRNGENTRAVAYSWRGLGHADRGTACITRYQLGQ